MHPNRTRLRPRNRRSHAEWANGYTLMAVMMKYDNVASAWMSSQLDLCRAAGIVTLFTQVTFPLALVWPATRWYYLPVSVAFHLTAWWTMDTGPYITLWLLLVAYLPLERVPGWVAAPWLARSLPLAFARTLVATVPTALVLRILWSYFPSWTLLPGLAVLAWVVCRVLREHPPPRPAGIGT